MYATSTRGRYFGGIANIAQTDVFDLPEHDPDFDNVARAATNAMIADLVSDLDLRREDATLAEFLILEAA